MSARGLDDRAGWNPDHKRSSYVSVLNPDDLAKSANFQGAEDYFIFRDIVSPKDMKDEGVMKMWSALFPGMEEWIMDAQKVKVLIEHCKQACLKVTVQVETSNIMFVPCFIASTPNEQCFCKQTTYNGHYLMQFL